MPRRPRKLLDDGFQVTAKGVAEAMIFLDDSDCSFFLWQLRGVIERFDWTFDAYCLMGMHILLLHELGGFAEQHRGLCCPGARRHRLPDAARSSTAPQSQVRARERTGAGEQRRRQQRALLDHDNDLFDARPAGSA